MLESCQRSPSPALSQINVLGLMAPPPWPAPRDWRLARSAGRRPVDALAVISKWIRFSGTTIALIAYASVRYAATDLGFAGVGPAGRRRSRSVVCNYPRNRQQDTIRQDKRFAIASSKRAQVSWHSFDLHQAR